MSDARFVVLVSILVFGIGAGAAQAQSERTLVATGSTEMPVAIIHDTYPVWTGGGLVVVEGISLPSPTVYLISKNGEIVSRFSFTIPKLHPYSVYDHCVARGPDGRILLAGLATTDDGDYTAFLATVAPDGTSTTVIHLAPFLPAAATISADGTIWVAGAVHPKRGDKADTDQYLIRRYDSKGDLLNSFVKWSDITTRDYHVTPAHESQLLASKDRIAWYSPTVNSYIEFSLDGKIMTQIKSWPALAEYAMDWPVLCDDGSVFVGEQVNGSDVLPAKYGIFTLNRDKGTWNFETRTEYTHLLGCDGTSVAGFSGNERTLTWFEAGQPQKESAQAVGQR